MLRLPALLLQARGTLTPPENWPEDATLRSAWRLEAVCVGVSALATDPPPPVDTAGVGVLLPAADAGDLCPVMGMDDLLPVAGGGDLCPIMGVDDLLPVAGVGDLRPAPVWATSALSSRGVAPPVNPM